MIAMSDDETEWHQIEMLAAALMAGFIEKLDEGRPRKKYLDGKEEDRARAAMARLLRSGRPLTQDFRDCLAVLFDPSASAHPASDRKLVFKNRSGGRWPDHVRNTRIAQYIHNCIRREGDGVEAAQKKAAGVFGLSVSTIRDMPGAGRDRLARRFGRERGGNAMRWQCISPGWSLFHPPFDNIFWSIASTEWGEIPSSTNPGFSGDDTVSICISST